MTSIRSLAFAVFPFLALGGLAMPAAAAAPLCTDSSAACLEKTARTYLDGLLSHDGSKVPLAPNVRRTENALTNARGEHQVRESFVRTNMVKKVRDVQFWTDTAKGEIVLFFNLDIDLAKEDISEGGTTKAGGADYKVAVTVPAGTYTVHEAERFKIVKGLITEIEILAHVETGKGGGSGWPIERDAEVKK